APHELSRLLFVSPPDSANHHHRLGLRVRLECAEAVGEARADEGIPANPDAGGLAVAAGRELVDDLVGERAAPRHDADPAGRANVPGNDPDLALARRDQARAVGADEPCAALVQI